MKKLFVLGTLALLLAGCGSRGQSSTTGRDGSRSSGINLTPTSDGSRPMGSQSPYGLDLYPGSEILKVTSESRTKDGIRVVILRWTPDPVDDVIKFYSERIPNHKRYNSTATSSLVSKEGQLSILISAEKREDGMTNILITLNQKLT